MTYATASAAQLYEDLRTRRNIFELEAEEAARLTIPSLFPVRGHAEGTRFEKPRNGIGARGVNHMSSRLLMATLPARASFFRMVMDGVALKALADEPEGRAEVEETLAEMEREVQKSIAVGGIRVPAAEAYKQLIVTGNVLVHMPSDSERMYTHTLRNYVVARDLEDNLLLIVLREEIAEDALSKELRLHVEGRREQNEEPTTGAGDANSGVIAVYTKVWLADGKYEVVQEVSGAAVEGTQASYTAEDLPWRPLRWVRVDNEQYGRSLISEYLGTLSDVEVISKALVEGAVAAARVIPLVNPNSSLDPEDIQNAENGEAVYGKEGDLTFAQLNKFADFRVAREELEDKRRELSAVFLLNIARNAERVTAEEIRLFADELEASHAGTFTLMATEFQLPLVQRILARLGKDGAVSRIKPKLQKHIRPAIVTGVDALGRSQDLEKIGAVFRALQGVLSPDQLQAYARPGTLLQFALTSAGLDIPGAVKTDEEVKQEQQVNQQQAMLASAAQNAAGPAAQGLVNNPEAAAKFAQSLGANQQQ